ncbi:DUF1120 domain-containing protein [Buttiauxella agrestis]|uniref:Beta-fimbriae putative major subunit n=1 Tax=Buttiauxella agrestis ATCC 33320 TaxID=1006004 RepID=A0A085FYX3_9ENTR|nr:DUF1120 domain-containing protein [Buttiauxella agrestis]KFC76668.1 beta-fimbriae putative major subunit [Buttiauxella agrestis ATCC 33320]
MLNKMKLKTFALAITACTVYSAMAADTADVHVIGSISPAACTPTISGGGTIDYGNIKASSLKADDYTVLDVKTLDIAITCSAPTVVGIHAINGRPNTLAGGGQSSVTGQSQQSPVVLLGMPTTYAVGLGLDGSTPIGGYAGKLDTSSVLLDGVAVEGLNATSTDGSGTWSKYSKGVLYTPFGFDLFSWGASGSSVPVAFTNMTGKLSVQAYINKSSELQLSKTINLDGLTTIELVYL